MTPGALHGALLDPDVVRGWNLAAWDDCIRQAARCDLIARLHAALAARGLLDTVPAPPRAHLEAARVLVDKHRRDVAFEIECIEEALRPVDTPVLLLKGAAYVAADLPLARTRLFSDVDIMVPRERLGEVERALRRNGWSPASRDAYDDSYYRRFTHELPPFVHAFRGTLLDVHHNILPPTASPSPDAPRLLADARVLRRRLRVLCPVDMFLHSATHLFHEGEFDHGFRDLVDLRDLLECFREEEAFAPRLARRAREFGLARTVHHALRATARFFGDDAVPEALAGGIPHGGMDAAGQHLMDALFDRALAPLHPTCDDAFSGAARFALYLRGHWLRMPPRLLLPHLARKSLRRLVRSPST